MAMVAAVTMAVVAGTTAVAVAADTMAVAVNANSGSAADAVKHMGR